MYSSSYNVNPLSLNLGTVMHDINVAASSQFGCLLANIEPLGIYTEGLY